MYEKEINPYESLPDNRFWKKGVTLNSPKIHDIYTPTFSLTKEKPIATAGSCFAQHIHKTLKLHNYNVLEIESPPQSLKKSEYANNGYGMYSARYGNIYTVKQLSQLSKEALGTIQIFEAWEKDGKYSDSQRPNINPSGYKTKEEVFQSRKEHLNYVLQMFKEMEVFIFTLGLTEAWMNQDKTVVYPTAPGVVSGQFDEEKFTWVNSNFMDIIKDFKSFEETVQSIRDYKPYKILLTVSPVPLTATYSDKHILAANTYSKSTLRSVAGHLSEMNDHIDYFPSYELITNPRNHSSWYEANLRSVRHEAVENVMNIFLKSQAHNNEECAITQASDSLSPIVTEREADKNIICEEELLERFERNKSAIIGDSIKKIQEQHSILIYGDSHAPSTYTATVEYFKTRGINASTYCLHHFLLTEGSSTKYLDWSNLNNLLASFKKEHHETIISWFNSKHKSLLYTGLLGGNYAFGVLRPLAGERIEGKFIKKSCESIPIVQKTDEIKDEIINSWKKQITSYNKEINKLNQQAGHSFHWIASPMLSSKAATAWAGAEYVNHLSQSIYNKRYNELIEEILGENLNFISFPDKYNLNENGFLDDRFQMPDRIDEDIHSAAMLYHKTIKSIFEKLEIIKSNLN